MLTGACHPCDLLILIGGKEVCKLAVLEAQEEAQNTTWGNPKDMAHGGTAALGTSQMNGCFLLVPATPSMQMPEPRLYNTDKTDGSLGHGRASEPQRASGKQVRSG